MPRSAGMTIDELFDVIQTGLEHGVPVQASFDEQLWYPRSILYNPEGLANDTGGSYGARDLRAPFNTVSATGQLQPRRLGADPPPP